MNITKSQAISNRRYQERKRRESNTPTAGELRQQRTAQFIETATVTHNGQYTYGGVQYTRQDVKVTITCGIHGNFSQTPSAHMRGQGCPQCGKLARKATRKRKTTSEFCTEASTVHEMAYGYDGVEYVNTITKVPIVCSKHGEFMQSPKAHLEGQGCPQCANIARAAIHQSRGERKIEKFLNDHNIEYKTQQMFEGCIHILPLKYDFYLPVYNTLIEFDGQQHHEYIKRFHRNRRGFEMQLLRDRIKTNFAYEAGFKLVRIPWYDEHSIDDVIRQLVS